MRNRSIRSEWNAPEAAAAAVCVPVSTATIPLGTLWIYSARERDFSDEEVNLIEIVAGRLASDLEREVLVQEGLQAAFLKRQVADAERLQEQQLPRSAPLSPRWDVDGWTIRGDRLGGDFYDWFPHGEDGLAIAVGSAGGSAIPAALLSGIMRTAIRTRSDAQREPHQLLEVVNRDLWHAAAGLQSAALAYALLDGTGRIRLATAGDVAILLARQAGWQLLSRVSLPFAHNPARATRHCCMRSSRTRRCWCSRALIRARTHLRPRRPAQLTWERLPKSWANGGTQSARELAAALRYQLSTPALPAGRDRTVLVVKPRRG